MSLTSNLKKKVRGILLKYFWCLLWVEITSKNSFYNKILFLSAQHFSEASNWKEFQRHSISSKWMKQRGANICRINLLTNGIYLFSTIDGGNVWFRGCFSLESCEGLHRFSCLNKIYIRLNLRLRRNLILKHIFLVALPILLLIILQLGYRLLLSLNNVEGWNIKACSKIQGVHKNIYRRVKFFFNKQQNLLRPRDQIYWKIEKQILFF